jgi:tetratricopeptide (TPR) repeat protein
MEFRVLLGDAWQQLGPRSEFAPDDFTNRDKRRNLRKRIRRTRVERLNELLETPEGQAANAANLAQARSVYEDVLARDPAYAAAYRGLGEAFEAQNEPREAAKAYLEYVRRAPDAQDRPVIIGRLTAIRDRLVQEEN